MHSVSGLLFIHIMSDPSLASSNSMEKQASHDLVLGQPVHLILGEVHSGGGAWSGVSVAMETPGGGACPGFSVAISGGGSLSDGGSTAISVAPLQKTHGGLLPTPFSSTNQDPLHLSLDNET